MAVGAAGVERRPGDVEVRPRQPGGELAQERRGEQAAAPADPVVLGEVGDLAAADPLVHLLGDRHRPLLPRRRSRRAASTCVDDVLADRCTPAIRSPSATTMWPVRVATSRITSGFCSVARTSASAEDQPALGVGVEHLDRGAAVHRQHVAGPVAPTRRPCSRPSARTCVTLTGRPSAAIANVAWTTAAAPAMSHFMSFMLVRRLDRQPAGVEGDALADQREVGLGVPRRVGQLDQPRRGARAARRRRGCRRSRARRACSRRARRSVTLGAPRPLPSFLRGLDDRVGERRRASGRPGGVLTQSRVAATAVGDDLRLLERRRRLLLAGRRAEHDDVAGRPSPPFWLPSCTS